MDMILEILLEIVVEGAMTGIGSGKVPLAVRILLALICVGIYGGLIALCVYLSVETGSVLPAIIGAAVALLFAAAIIKTWRKR